MVTENQKSVYQGNQNNRVSGGRIYFTIQPRVLWTLPNQRIELPPPFRLPSAPSPLNLLLLFLPTILSLVIMGIMIAISIQSAERGGMSFLYLWGMFFLSLVWPVVNLISHKNRIKKYLIALQVRDQSYRLALAEVRDRLDILVKQQQDVLQKEYPYPSRLVSIGINHDKQLWQRRTADSDYLSLRMGVGSCKPSFSVIVPPNLDPEDPLATLALELSYAYQEVPQIPLLLDMLKVGSVALDDKGQNNAYNFARHLILDVIVHHSPQDVQIVILADTPQAQDRWEWLKWTPHTRALSQEKANLSLAFNATAIDKSLEWLMGEYNGRVRPEPGVRKKHSSRNSIVVFLDDSEEIRRSDDIRQLTQYGRDADIYLIFVSGRYWPRECREVVDIFEHEFKYIHLDSSALREGNREQVQQGAVETTSLADCERVARALAGLYLLSSGENNSILPESVRLSEVLEVKDLSLLKLKQNWGKIWNDDELLQFPFGLRNGRKGLQPIVLNLLPPGPEYAGFGAYHTLLVGTTGSGKSEFIKSLVLSAAYKYPPTLLNFFFMDFKGGVAFNDLKDLPHVVGIVTNLNPELVNRGLIALEGEFERRLEMFRNAGVSNIWGYNSVCPNNPMPHLMLFLDEFARGLSDFSRLPEILDKLIRISRSLGVYLLLANQDANYEVDRLVNNVGWHIALKVARQEEMYIINRSLPKAERTGQGYLHSLNGDIYEFQAAYAGFTVIDANDNVEQDFNIYQIDYDGKWKSFYTNTRSVSTAEKNLYKPKEQDIIISSIKKMLGEFKSARPIYLEPLEPNIPLENVLQELGIQRAFSKGVWNSKLMENWLTVPIGITDSPKTCTQECLQVDFNAQDGHLWLIGGPSSGKTMTIETFLLSLALTHTPEEVQFYIIEFGAAKRLRYIKSLPHCGAVIMPEDPVEMLDKLLQFLDDEMNRRANLNSQAERMPQIFLVINNFVELRNSYPDHADRIAPYINGKSMGLHLIISTNRKMELPPKLAIARKVVLRLANRDDYSDIVGSREVPFPVLQAEGRGIWVDGSPLECQIAQPSVSLAGDGSLLQAQAVFEAMTRSWSGPVATPIRVLPEKILLQDLLIQTAAFKKESFPIPVGVSFENMQLVSAHLLKEISRWLVLGPRRSGKSNFLASLANTVETRYPDQWNIIYLSFRRAVPSSLNKNSIRTSSTLTEITQTLTELMETFDQEKNHKRILLLLDDLGSAFEPGKEALSMALNNLSLKTYTREDVFIVGAGSIEDLRISLVNSPLVKSLKEGRTGISFSSADLDVLSAQVSPRYRRMELPAGRGFWVNNGKAMLVQTPWAGTYFE